MSEELSIVQLIRTRIKKIGSGTESDPVRIIPKFWDMDGNLVFEWDPHFQEGDMYGDGRFSE